MNLLYDNYHKKLLRVFIVTYYYIFNRYTIVSVIERYDNIHDGSYIHIHSIVHYISVYRSVVFITAKYKLKTIYFENIIICNEKYDNWKKNHKF